MKPCIIGIGGTGGKVLKEFLRNEDIPILGMSLGEHISFGGVKGIWMDFDTAECENEQKNNKFYTGRLEDGNYPGFIVPPEVLRDNSRVRDYINNEYGYDLRKQGFDRRAEYMKAIFEIFQTDPKAKALSQEESGADNLLLAYIWQRAISKFLTIGKVSGQSGEDAGSSLASQGGMEESQANDEGQKKTASIQNPVSETEGPTGQAESHPSQTEPSPSNGKIGNESAKNRLPAGNLPNLLAINKIGRVGSSLLSKIKASNGDNGGNKCESLLFIASLGGGTGTGFINPLTSFIRTRGSLLALALCLFTEKGIDGKGTLEEQRDLGAIIAMYDLLTKRRGKDAIDALMLIDNQILQSVYGGRNYSAMNKAIFEAMRPFIDQRRYPDYDDEALGVQRVFNEGLDLPCVLVPCYFSIDSAQITEADLVNSALSKGKLFPCDVKKTDEAYIFSRGLLDPAKMVNALKDAIGKDKKGNEKVVHVYPKIGEDKSAEILILLRNPYGGERSNFSRNSCGKPCSNEDAWKKTLSENFEQRVYCAICMGLRYLAEYEKEIIPSGMKAVTKAKLGDYLYGLDWVERNLKLLDEVPIQNDQDKEFKKWLEEAKKQHLESNIPFLKDELERALVRIESGVKPIFTQELNIFSLNKKIEDEPGPLKADVVDLQALQPMIEGEVRRILGKIGYPTEEN